MSFFNRLKIFTRRLGILFLFRLSTIRKLWIIASLIGPIILGFVSSYAVKQNMQITNDQVVFFVYCLRALLIAFPFQVALSSVMIVDFAKGEFRSVEDHGVISGLPLRYSIIVLVDLLISFLLVIIQFIVIDLIIILNLGWNQMTFSVLLSIGLSLFASIFIVSIFVVVLIIAISEILPSNIALFILPLLFLFWSPIFGSIIVILGLTPQVYLLKPETMISFLAVITFGITDELVLNILFPQADGNINLIINSLIGFLYVVAFLLTLAFIVRKAKRELL